MVIAVRRYGLTWTDPDGAAQAPAAVFEKSAAIRRRRALEASGGDGTWAEIAYTRPQAKPVWFTSPEVTPDA